MKRVVLALAFSLVALLLWDFSGADRWVAQQLGSQAGFAWREAAAARQAYELGRWVVGTGFLWLAVSLMCFRSLVASASRAEGDGPVAARWTSRSAWLLVALAGWLLVLGLKRISLTSCPWDLAEFGGVAQWVSHWQWGVPDGGPGRCFPSGHASGGFALFAGYFAWRQTHPGRARAWLAFALVMGLFMGATQVLRGAHHVSHVLWAGWLCATLAWASALLHQRIWPEPGRSLRPARAWNSPPQSHLS